MASLDKYKLTQNQWDSDKNPTGFWEFMYLMSSTVRVIAYGAILEDYLDAKLGRVTQHAVMTPSFITDDPDFGPNPNNAGAGGEASADTASTTSGSASNQSNAQSNATTGSQMLNSVGSYWDLDAEALALDGMLFNILKVCILGSKRVLLLSATIPSYIMGMCILARHADISKTDRITKAFDSLNRFQFNGNITVWQTEGVAKIRELLDSKASIMHYILSRIMKSFNGKLKTIQYRIAEDINSRVITDNTNVFDMMQQYAVEIASVGDTTLNGVNAVGEEQQAQIPLCRYCGKSRHLETDCRTKKYDQQNGTDNRAGKAGDSGKEARVEKRTCHGCGQKGHLRRDCPKLKGGQPVMTAQGGADEEAILKAAQQIMTRRSANQPAETPAQPAAAAPVQGVNPGLSELLARLQTSAQQYVAASDARNETQADPIHQDYNGCIQDFESDYSEYGDVEELLCTCSQDSESDCMYCKLCPLCCDCSRDTAYGLRGDAHIGEADHPGPISFLPRLFPTLGASGGLILKAFLTMVTVLSICDGMGCAAMALKNNSADIDRYVAVEIDGKARKIAQFANPKTDRFPGLDHSVCNDMYNLTEQDIAEMGDIILFIGATPCGDFSMLRLLPDRKSPLKHLRWRTVDPRPGLDGPNGDKFRQLILILSWVVKHNPSCEFFIENLHFDDLSKDWEEVCRALGQPNRVNAQDYSRTKRNRAYWNNFKNKIRLPPAVDPPSGS